jgi:hypothetical protein
MADGEWRMANGGWRVVTASPRHFLAHYPSPITHYELVASDADASLMPLPPSAGCPLHIGDA